MPACSSMAAIMCGRLFDVQGLAPRRAESQELWPAGTERRVHASCLSNFQQWSKVLPGKRRSEPPAEQKTIVTILEVIHSHYVFFFLSFKLNFGCGALNHFHSPWFSSIPLLKRGSWTSVTQYCSWLAELCSLRCGGGASPSSWLMLLQLWKKQ